MTDRAVVTGVGVWTPLGTDAAATWAALTARQTAVAPIRGFDPGAFAVRVAAVLAPLDEDALGVQPREGRILGVPGLALLGAAREAARAAGLADAGVAAERLAAFVAMGAPDPNPDDLAPALVRAGGTGGPDLPAFYGGTYCEIDPLWPLTMLNNVGFSLVAIHLAAKGENLVLAPGADAGVAALIEAAAAVRDGRAAAAYAGGASEAVTPWGLSRALRLGLVGPDGAAPGEGAGCLVLEPADAVRPRRACPLAAVAGWAERTGDAEAAADALAAALAAAGGGPVDAVFWNAAGALGREAVTRVAPGALLVDHAPVWGHAMAGSAAMDAALAARAIGTGDPLPGGPPGPLRRALVVGHGAGGGYAALVLTRVD
jgi:3-oxoacyl-[acyl-carrier-protein] synthase II